MAIRPTVFRQNDMDVWHDELNHGGTVLYTALTYPKTPSGANNLDLLILNCPAGCGSSSLHPIGGGCRPRAIQTMFAMKKMKDTPNKTWATAQTEVMTAADAMDGPGRRRIEDVVFTNNVPVFVNPSNPD